MAQHGLLLHGRFARRHSCRICAVTTGRDVFGRLHRAAAHGLFSRRFSCRVCAKTSPTAENDREHRKVLHGLFSRRTSCRMCAHTATSASNGRVHRVMVHGAFSRRFSCRACALPWRLEREMRRHLAAGFCFPALCAFSPQRAVLGPCFGLLARDASAAAPEGLELYACEEHVKLLAACPGASFWPPIKAGGTMHGWFMHDGAKAPERLDAVAIGALSGAARAAIAAVVGPNRAPTIFDPRWAMRPYSRPMRGLSALDASLSIVDLEGAVKLFLGNFPTVTFSGLGSFMGVWLADGLFSTLDLVYGENELLGIAEYDRLAFELGATTWEGTLQGAVLRRMRSGGAPQLLGLLETLGMAPGAKTITPALIRAFIGWAGRPPGDAMRIVAQSLIAGLIQGDGSGSPSRSTSFVQSLTFVYLEAS